MTKKIFKYVAATIAILALLIVLADAGLIWGMAHIRPQINHANSIIVLGAAINTPALHNRTLEGLQLYQQGKADEMVLSGGKIADPDISEAQYMEKVIKQTTDQPVNYILEDQSHNTYENIENAKSKLVAAGVPTDSVIIVSDAFHLARGFLIAKRAGFKTVYWSAPSDESYTHKELAFYYTREFVAIINYIPRFIFG